MNLNLGCGQKLLQDHVNVDVAPLAGVDVVADLNRGLPFRDSSVSHVVMDSVLEHLNDVGAALKEVHRVLSPGGVVLVIVPHAFSLDAYRDPTHRHFFVYGTFDFFVEGHHRQYYYGFAFRSASRRFVFSRSNFMSRWLQKAANRRPWLYENTVLRAFPCIGLEVELMK